MIICSRGCCLQPPALVHDLCVHRRGWRPHLDTVLGGRRAVHPRDARPEPCPAASLGLHPGHTAACRATVSSFLRCVDGDTSPPAPAEAKREGARVVTAQIHTRSWLVPRGCAERPDVPGIGSTWGTRGGTAPLVTGRCPPGREAQGQATVSSLWPSDVRNRHPRIWGVSAFLPSAQQPVTRSGIRGVWETRGKVLLAGWLGRPETLLARRVEGPWPRSSGRTEATAGQVCALTRRGATVPRCPACVVVSLRRWDQTATQWALSGWQRKSRLLKIRWIRRGSALTAESGPRASPAHNPQPWEEARARDACPANKGE